MLWFMAGAASTLQVHAITVVVSMSSAIPFAILPSTFAVAGATSTKSACFARATCSTENSKFRSKVSIRHLFPVKVSNVVAVIKLVACSVISTWTLQWSFFNILATLGILYAAIPPVTPSKTVFPCSISGNLLSERACCGIAFRVGYMEICPCFSYAATLEILFSPSTNTTLGRNPSASSGVIWA